MAAETRSVTVRLRLEMAGFEAEMRRAAGASDRLTKNLDRSSSATDKLIRTARNLALGAGLAKVATDAVRLEAAYSKTMAQIAVQTKAPQSELKELDRLALKMGADTVFSAQDAANAMLQLSKGGLTSAQIKAGALADTLTLASAGGLDLGVAADTVVQAMGAFRLRADQTNVAVAALAGSANASSADVSDMTQALAQAGTTANSAGLNIQETTAYLALFANQGFKGSDAGTSLRTMLSRLVPQTDEAKNAMAELGLTYLDANGNLVDATEIAKRTQDAFSGLNDQQKITAVNAIFGADAQRGVNAITAEGDEGLKKYLKSTTDLTQAQQLADAANSGTAGSLEQLKGAIETAEIQIGKGLAPVVQDLAGKVNDLVSGGDVEGWARDGGAALSDFLDEVGPLAQSLGALAVEAFPTVRSAAKSAIDVLELAADVVTPLVEAFNSLPDAAQKALILAGGAKVLSSRMGGIPGLAGPAGSSLFTFGGQAEKAGDKAGKAAPGFSALAGSLKGYAGLAAGFAALDLGSDFLDTARRSLRAGDGPADTIGRIEKQLKDSNVGKYADDLSIDVRKLATEMARSGDEGEYYTKTLARLKGTYEGLGGGAKSALDTFLNPFIASTEQAKFAVLDLEDVVKGAGLAVDDAKNGYNLAISGLGAYSEELRGLPTKAVTEITTPGAVKSAQDVLDLQRRFALTPDEVETIMNALDLAKPVIKGVRSALNGIDGDVATVTIRTIRETIKKSFTEDQGGNSPGVDKAFKDRPYTGMRLPTGYAAGGRRVPGTPPQDPTKDNVFARGAETGQPLLVRSGEWIINEPQSEKNDAWLRAINDGLVMDDLFGAYSGGGLASRYAKATTSPVMATAGSLSGAAAAQPTGPLAIDDLSARYLARELSRGVSVGLSNARFVDEDGRSLRVILQDG